MLFDDKTITKRSLNEQTRSYYRLALIVLQFNVNKFDFSHAIDNKILINES